MLEARFTVHAVDRRGRGASGDAVTYAIEREFEDIAAVVDSVGQPVYLLGHSYGAVCSLEAARLSRNVRKLVLYEPPVPVGIPISPPGLIQRLQKLLDQGEREAVVTTFFRDVPRLPPQEIEILQSLPNWPARVAAAHTIPRELGIENTYRWQPERFGELHTPTLLLVGGDSPPFLKKASEAVQQALPSSQIVLMPGQQHTAMNTAPDLFLREVFAFLN
jgi:pimeloyl-ACP methyl ester carboxylesterase